MKKKRNVLGVGIPVGMTLLTISYLLWQNNDIILTNYDYSSDKLSKELDGFRIVHISDLHNKDFGCRLYETMEKAAPHIIVITGDLIDRRRPNVKVANEFIRRASQIAPIYYVAGNHEARSNHTGELFDCLDRWNVTMLNNTATEITLGGASFHLIGIFDPIFAVGMPAPTKEAPTLFLKETIENNLDEGKLNVLLTHHPEYFQLYADCGIDLAFSGHAHGGQIRVPFVGGLFAPDQGFFPKYTSGIQTVSGMKLVISRGLGNSLFPTRICNRPEVICLTLHSKERFNRK